MQGDRLPPEKAKEVARQVARYTGLDPVYVERSNLRVDPARFRSKSRNTHFAGWTLTGGPWMTIVGGKVVRL